MSDRRWLAAYSGVLILGFVPLYLWTRLPLFVSDSATFFEEARLGDPRRASFGYPGHYLQIVLASGLWRGLRRLHIDVSLERVWFSLCLAGTLAAVILFGLIAARIFRDRAAAWLAAFLLGTSLNVWWQWNGELYALALGFLTAAIFVALRGQVLAAALLWALSVTCHIDFVLAGPAVVAALWLSRAEHDSVRDFVRRASIAVAVAGVMTLTVFLLPTWVMGKWHGIEGLRRWLSIYYQLGEESGQVQPSPEVFRAAKGLLTAYTVAGHYWRDILTGRGAPGATFVLASAAGLVVLAATAACLVAAIRRRETLWFALAWLVPFQVGFNWWFNPNDSKYHAGALPGFVLLVTAGLVHLTAGLRGSRRNAIWIAYAGSCAALNLFGSILPMQRFGADAVDAAHAIHQLNDERGGKAALLSCTDSHAVVLSGIENLRVKRIWNGNSRDAQAQIAAWFHARQAEGKSIFVLDRWCRPDEWFVPPQPPFDMYFVERDFTIAPTRIAGVPVARVWETNPFSWRRGAVVELLPKQ